MDMLKNESFLQEFPLSQIYSIAFIFPEIVPVRKENSNRIPES